LFSIRRRISFPVFIFFNKGETPMRFMMTAVAALAVCSLFASKAVRAEEVHYAGGPVQAGNQCWVSTNNDNGFGYWRDCPKPVHTSKTK
jgi:hypothetical protein